MNPLSIVTNPLAILHVVDGLASLVSVLEDFANTSRDLASLEREISGLRIVLDKVLSLASTGEQLSVLRESVAASLTMVTRLELLIWNIPGRKTGGSSQRRKAALQSLVWLRKKRRVETIKQQLRDGISTIQLEILSLSLLSQHRCSVALERFGSMIDAAETNLGPTCLISMDSSSETGSVPIPFPSKCSGFIVEKNSTTNPIGVRNYAVHWNENNNIETPVHLDPELGAYCKGNLNVKSQNWTSWVAGFFCLVILECYQRSVPQSKSSHYSSLRRLILDITSASMSFYTPWNPAKPIFRINYSTLPSPSLSLSFPRILPPDSDIFIYIRSGRIEEVKNLLIQGRASVLDIAAPFGLSTISLALSYRRMDIYTFLVTAGGYKCRGMCSDTTGADQFEFWMNFASQDYKMSATAILRDEIQQVASMAGVSQHNGDTLYSGDYESLTRLHKCVLGLTTENLRDLLPQLPYLDEVDSFGHTALHLAAYRNNTDTIALLLTCGADPELQDNTGKTALHISATHNSADCTKVLARSGANIHTKDHLGNTPLHHACKLGHLRVLEVLLEHGADIQECNYFGETSLTYANLGGQLAAVQLLLRHNADLTHRDKLGTTLVHDAIWFNSHDALEFYLKNSMRVDQKLLNGKSTLHLLAEEGDLTTMKIFLDFAYIGIEDLRVDDKDDRGYTATQYLECRRDADEVMPQFHLVLERVSKARYYSVPKDGNENFWDALEVQP